MNKIYQILWIGFLVLSCKEQPARNESTYQKNEFNQTLANELKSMAEIDQLAASNFVPPTNFSHLSLEEWESFQDSVYTSHQLRLKEIFRKHGYVGFDLAGEDGSRNFWLMVQHSDQHPQFQKEVLRKMKIEVDRKNADSKTYGLLVDRVKINTGQPQIYGTQVDYTMDPCQAFPKKLVDSVNVNERRKEIGLQPIEEYLNMMTLMNCNRLKELESKKQKLN